MSNLVYGVVVDNFLYSNRMELKLRKKVSNGIYSMDMNQDDFQESLSPANIEDARGFFSKASKVKLIRGVSFHDGIVPENPVSYEKIPIKVLDATYDDFEEVEVAVLRNKICYYIQTVSTAKAYPLMDLKEAVSAEKIADINSLKGITPEMRIIYAFHLLEKKRKEMEEPVNAIKAIMGASGAEVTSVKKTNHGFEVIWKVGRHEIHSLLDKNFRVSHGGFCMSGHDKTQTAGSIVNVLKDYVKDGSYIHITRV
jgi:hypothetical protein